MFDWGTLQVFTFKLIITLAIIFIIVRKFILWYFKLSAIENHLENIETYMKVIAQKIDPDANFDDDEDDEVMQKPKQKYVYKDGVLPLSRKRSDIKD